MNRKLLKWFLVILGLSASLVSIGIGIYVYSNPLADNAQFLLGFLKKIIGSNQ